MDHWNDDGVWGRGQDPPAQWNELRYPGLHLWDGQSIDLAFRIISCVQGDCAGDGVDDTEDISSGTSCDCNDTGVPDVGDFNVDGDVDLDDYTTFADCMAGPDVHTPPGGCMSEQFGQADLDYDADVDLEDFVAFQNAFAGSLTPPTFYPTDDTFIDMYYSDNNYGTLTYVVVRNRDGGGSSIWEYDALVRFDLSSIPPETSFASATLYLYYYNWGDNDPAGRELTSHRITGDWDEDTVTYNTRPTHDAEVTDGSIVPATTGVWMTWDVTSDVQAFLDGQETNYGWIIMDEVPWGQGGIPYAVFHTKENGDFIPYLYIE